MRIAFYSDQYDNEPRDGFGRVVPGGVEVDLDTLAQWLSEPGSWRGACTLATCVGHHCPYKARHAHLHVSAWSPVRLDHVGYDAEHKVGTRRKENALGVSLLVVDFDQIPLEALAVLAQKLSGWTYIAHSTHADRSSVGGLTSIRVIIQIESEVPAAEWPAYWAGALHLLGFDDPALLSKKDGGFLELPAHGVDRTCKDSSRLYYLPSHPADYPNPIYERGYGKALPRRLPSLSAAVFGTLPPALTAPLAPDVGALVALAAQASAQQVQRAQPQYYGPMVVSVPRVPPPPASVDLGELRAMLAEHRRSLAHRMDRGEKAKADLLGRVLAGEPIADPGSRGSTILQLASICAFEFPRGTPVEAFLEIIRPSMAATSTAPTPGSNSQAPVDHWAHAAKKYAEAQVRREKVSAEADAAREMLNKMLAGPNRRAASLPPPATTVAAPPGVLGPPPLASAAPTFQPQAQLRAPASGDYPGSDLPYLLTGDGTLMNCGENVRRLIERFMPGVFRWNAYSKKIDIVASDDLESFVRAEVEKWIKMNSPDDVAVAVTDSLTVWCQGSVTWKLTDVEKRIMLVARQNSYNPLVDYLLSRIWDKVKRIDSWLPTYTGCDDTPLMRRIGRMWMIAAVERALNPGCKVDNMLVLASDGQGTKKTSLLTALGGPFFSSTAIDSSKDSLIAASSNWILCYDELAARTSSQLEEYFKNYVTRQWDRYRPPYGKHEVTEPRSCVLVGATDKQGFLTDIAGNRRYWIVRVRKIDMEGLLRDRDQLWAEAVAYYRESIDCQECARSTDTVYGQRARCYQHRWWFSREEEDVMAAETSRYEEEEFLQPRIVDWWLEMPPQRRPDFMTVADVAMGAIKGLDLERLTKQTCLAVQRAVLKIRDDAGKPCFRRDQRVVSGIKTWGVAPTEEMKSRVRAPNGGSFYMVSGGAADAVRAQVPTAQSQVVSAQQQAVATSVGGSHLQLVQQPALPQPPLQPSPPYQQQPAVGFAARADERFDGALPAPPSWEPVRR